MVAAGLALITWLSSAGGALAQAIDAGRVYDSVQPPRPPLTRPALPSVRQGKAAAAAAGSTADAGLRVAVNEWRISGATALPAAQLQLLLRPWTAKALSVAQMQDAAAAVVQAYRDAGFIYTRAAVLPQTIQDGIVTLTVQEDHLARLGQDDSGALALPGLAREGMARSQALGAPLNVQALERALLRINRLPAGGRASAELSLADAGDTSELDIRYQPAARAVGQVRADNHGNRYTGRARLLGQLGINNPLGRADRLSATLLTAGTPMSYVSLDHALPLSLGSTLALGTSALRYALCCQAAGQASEGWVRTTSVGLTHDAVVQRDQHLAGSLVLEWRRLGSDLGGAVDTRRKLQVLRLGAQGYELGDALNSWAAGLHVGRADLGGHAADLQADAAARQAHGGFRKLVLNYTRSPNPGTGWAWSANFHGQYNLGRNLESSERFALGGANAVRAHAVGEAAGDSGWVTQLALHYRAASVPGLAVAGFFDTGRTHQYSQNIAALATSSPNSYGLSGFGLGLTLVRPGYDVAATVAEPVGRHRGLDAQGLDAEGRPGDATRLWVSLGMGF